MQKFSESIQAFFNGSFSVEDVNFGSIAMMFLKALLLLFACIIIKRILTTSFGKLLGRTRIEKGLHTFLKSTLNILLWFVIIFIVASALDINATPLIAAFSVVGLAISLAVQDSLSNLAGGINILASKVFVVGDYVEIGDDAGTVHDIGLVHTSLTTIDNRRIMVPNSKVMSVRVINYSTEPKRRVDLKFTASYDAPIEQVKKVMERLVSDHPKVIHDPEPMVRVVDYEDSAVKYMVRVWCKNEDYWELYYDLMEQIKPTFQENGISIPYPQMDVHIIQNNR
jgi:small conductance mechanosensitive channel